MSFERHQFFGRSHIPDLDRLIVSSGGDCLAVRRIGDSTHDVRVPAQSCEGLARGHLPQPDGSIVGASDQNLAIGGQREGDDRGRMSIESH